MKPTTDQTDHAGATLASSGTRSIRIPPPLVFGVCFGAGTLLTRIAPIAVPSAARLAGAVLSACGLGLALSAVLLFAAKRTTIVPHGTARRLVARGPFGRTRNPMYLGLALARGGAAVALGSWGSLLALAAPLWFLEARVIPFEEHSLETRFGEDYRRYRESVPRWL